MTDKAYLGQTSPGPVRQRKGCRGERPCLSALPWLL